MLLVPRKTAATILCFGAFLMLLQSWKITPAARVVTPAPRVALPEIQSSTVVLKASPTLRYLTDHGHSMDTFYAALRNTESGHGITRILHYGDSPVTADSITADVRSLLQDRFGDAGHGFVLIARPWAWYSHHGVAIRHLMWRSEPATQGDRAKDGLHGLGGVAFEAGPGAWSVLTFDTTHTSLEISYLKQPRGGVFSVSAGNRMVGRVNTFSPRVQSGWSRFALPAQSHEVRIDVDSGAVRLFGINAENNQTGVVYNSLGLNGGQVQAVLRYFEPAHWTGQLQHQKPDLVVINYGTNESVYPKYLDTAYPGELRAVIGRVEAALPDVSILIMSPMDRGEKDAFGQIVTAPAVSHIVEIQKAIAAETGCAFFNTFQAMGGEGTMGRWYTSEPKLVTADFIHPFPAGARKVGVLLNDALLAGYERYKARTPR